MQVTKSPTCLVRTARTMSRHTAKRSFGAYRLYCLEKIHLEQFVSLSFILNKQRVSKKPEGKSWFYEVYVLVSTSHVHLQFVSKRHYHLHRKTE